MSFFICKTAKNIKILQKNGFKIAAKRSNSKNLDGIIEIKVSKAR
jgi:translation elongation factor EF-Ts